MAAALALPDAGMPEVRRLLNDVPAGLKRDGKWTVADVVVFVDPEGQPAYEITPLRVSIHDSLKPPVDFDKPDREGLVLSLATLPVTSDGIRSRA